MPLNHIGGLSVLFRMFEVGGMTIVSPFGPHIGEVVVRTTPSVVSLVPTMVRRLLNSDADGLASVGTILVGGAGLDGSIAQAATTRGVSLTPTYGMTETSSQIATAVPGEPWSGSGFVGQPLDGFTVEVDPTGRLVVEGPAVFGGYLGRHRRTSGFRTSDFGSIDAEGNLTVLGRVDDVVVSGGENVSLTLVEGELRDIDGVYDTAVVGIPDAEWGTAVGAMVVTDLAGSAVKALLADLVSAHELPKRWLFVASLPLLPNGKPDVPAIREALSLG